MKKLSSRRESKGRPEKFHCHPNSKAVGCVSGIFHFFAAGRHGSSCKRLPSGSRRKDESGMISTENTKTASPPNEIGVYASRHSKSTVAQTAAAFLRNLRLRRQLSCEAPLLPPAARRPSSLDAAESPLRPTTLVERLMGLGEFPASSPETTAGKERKLLGAVRSCEDRLKSLKQIIAAVRAAEGGGRKIEAVEAVEWIEVGNVASSGDHRTGQEEPEEEEDGDSSTETVKSTDGNREQPSPVSVLLDAMTSPTMFPSKRSQHEIESEAQVTRTQPCEVGVNSYADECNKEPCNSVIRQVTMEGLRRMLKQNEQNELNEADPLGPAAARRRPAEGGRSRRRPWWLGYETRSRAMVETVCEVLERCGWEEGKEAGKVAVALERGIFCDLVDELGRELALHCNVVPTKG